MVLLCPYSTVRKPTLWPAPPDSLGSAGSPVPSRSAPSSDKETAQSVQSGLRENELNSVHSPVLVVDDDPAIRDTVFDALTFEGYEVLTATNGVEALDIIDRTLPCLLLLDMRMPVLDGWGVASRLHERGIEVPILVLTAARSAQVWAEEIGATHFLPKPFELDTLLDLVQKFC